jgi:formylglycine-generating enzyme required for sulfatase activity
MGDNPSRFNRHDFSVEQLIRWKGNRSFRNILDIPHFAKYQNCDTRPVEKVRWEEAKSFCDKLNERYAEKLPCGYKFDLPTEAQWEYACRAGTMTALNNGRILMDGDICIDLVEVAWYNSCDDSENKKEKAQTHPVGQKRPNAWGLYDMHGNVFEQVLTRFRNAVANGGDESDGPSDTIDKEVVVIRGGCWMYGLTSAGSGSARSIYVTGWNNQSGFRLYCPVPAE